MVALRPPPQPRTNTDSLFNEAEKCRLSRRTPLPGPVARVCRPHRRVSSGHLSRAPLPGELVLGPRIACKTFRVALACLSPRASRIRAEGLKGKSVQLLTLDVRLVSLVAGRRLVPKVDVAGGRARESVIAGIADAVFMQLLRRTSRRRWTAALLVVAPLPCLANKKGPRPSLPRASRIVANAGALAAPLAMRPTRPLAKRLRRR